MIRMKKYIAFFLAVALCCGIVAVIPEKDTVSYADNTMIAEPTSQGLFIRKNAGESGSTVVISATNPSAATNIPMYTITQSNGYGANYVKLRDICYYLDMDVVWDAETPNAMYIYTNRHYLDSWETSGPATTTKTAVVSAMDIYVNDVKVQSDSTPVLIDNNNYFKIRDLAKLVDVGCVYAPAANVTATTAQYSRYSGVLLDARFPYTEGETNVDEEGNPKGNAELSKYLVRKYPDLQREEKVYESSVWYGGDSGTLSDAPVTYSARDAWAREDYWNSELNKEYREYLESVKWENNPINPSEFNALVQLLLDTDKIAINNSGKQKENVYYQYPMAEKFLYPSLYSNGLWGYSNLPNLEIIENLCPDKNLEYNKQSATAQDCYVVQIAEKGSIWSASDGDTVVDGQTTSTAPFLVRATQIYAADVISKSKTFTTNREQVTYLAQQLCERMTYIGSSEWKQLQEQGKLGVSNSSGDDIYNYSVWKNRDVIYGGVCMGYTTHFSALASAAGFYVITYGVAENGDVDHSRNAVWLEDEGCWVAVDCTWADAYQNYLMGTGDRDDYICYDDGVPHWRMGSGPAKIYTAALQLSGDIRRADGEIKTTYTPTKDATSIKTDSNVNNSSLTNADTSDGYGDIDITTPTENEAAPERATIVFDANGGSWTDGSTTMNVTYEAGYCNALPPAPKRDGYTFWSWGYDCVWGESEDFPETCMSLSAGTNLEGKDGLVVQAIWKKK